MHVQQEGDDKKARFFIEENGVRIGNIEYVFAGTDKFIIEHTEVNEGHEGKGIGKILVEAAVDYARANNLKIIPLCPYANALFKKRAGEFADVLWSR